MFQIMRRYTPQVEEYSIDEAFADLTGLRRASRASYEKIAAAMRETIRKELGITVTAGLSVTKVLAKIASKHRKPDGFTAIPGRDIPRYLAGLPLEAVWGIGPATANHLLKLGARTALDFARFSEYRVRKNFTKPGVEIWRELRGNQSIPSFRKPKAPMPPSARRKPSPPPRETGNTFSPSSSGMSSRHASRPGGTTWPPEGSPSS